MKETLADEIIAGEGLETYKVNGHETGIGVEKQA